MSRSMTAATNGNGYVDRFIDAAGNIIYIEPQNYHEAVQEANSAATKAETAASSANSAASGLADIKQQASAAATNANNAADRVDASIESANTAAENANSAAAGATIAKDAANTAAKKASTAGDNVLAAKAEAESAASKANTAATKANTASDSALAAKAKADSAASEASTAANKAESAAFSANNAASVLANIKKQVTDAATNANNAADRVDTSIASAEAATAKANESAASANTATESAKAATTSANDAAKSATNAAGRADSAILGVESERQQLAEIRAESSNAVNKANKACTDATSALKKADDATDRLTTLEGQAASNESARADAESARASAEESRASAETARANAESARAESESARSAAETSRSASEQARAKAEKARSDADAQRETRQLKNDADQAQNNAAARGFTYHLCGEGEYALDSVDGKHNVPTVDGGAGVMYLTPKVDGASDEDAYDQWLFVGSKWELVGSSNAAHVDPVTTDDIDGISGGGTVTADRYLNATGLSYAWRKLTSGVSTDIETAVEPVSESVNDLKSKLSETKSVSDNNKSRIDTMENTVTGNSGKIATIEANETDRAKRLSAVESKAADNTGRISVLETKVSGMGTGGTGGTGGASVRAGGQDLSVVLADKISASGGTVYSVLHELVASEDFSNIMVGDYLDVTVGYAPGTSERSIRFVVAHINPYKGVGKTETASHIALVSAQPLTVNTSYQYAAGGPYLLWNSSGTNNSSDSGGCPYVGSVLHGWETSLWTALLDEFKQYGIDRQAYLEKRYNSSSDSTGNSWTSIGKLWSLSEKEVFGCDVLGTKGYSVGADVQFDLFRSGDALTGGKKSWWLRTVAGGSTSKACYVDSTGAPMAKDVTGAYVRPRVALLFG